MVELILEKYTTYPKKLILNENGMLECSGITIAEDVVTFDAATDKNGNIHGVFFNNSGEIVYFLLAGRVPTNKIMAVCVAQKSLKYLSVDEYGGIIHILIVKNDKNSVIYHYNTSNNEWIRNSPKIIDEATKVFASVAYDDGAMAILVSHKDAYKIYFNKKDTWQSEEIEIEAGYEDVSMTFFEDNIEIIIQKNNEQCVIKIPAEKFGGNINISSKIQVKKEREMANGTTINSKFISQLQDNTDMLTKLDIRHSELQRELESLRQIVESQQSLLKGLAAYKDTIRQYETQINHINIKIQELSNRLNGFAKQNR